MRAEAVYQAIVEQQLYDFKADNPSHLVRSQNRRHCIVLDFPSASRPKVFELNPDGRYFLATTDDSAAAASRPHRA
jgi:restriction system protein